MPFLTNQTGVKLGKIGKFGNYSHIGELPPNSSKTACNVVKCVYVIQNVDSGTFFERFAENQYLMYGLIHEKQGIHKRFEACYRDNLHSIWAGQELYRKGNSKEEFFGILEKNMQPVYDSARRQGYEVWNR